jgi:Transglutaminase-like superfamily
MIGRFLRLSATERTLPISAGFLVLSIRAALWVLPYQWVRQWLTQRRQITSAGSGYVSGATRVIQALVDEALLRTYRNEPSVDIGVYKTNSRDLEAHAWSEVQFKNMWGDAGTERFVPMRAPRGAM